jgi:hypothetical protein
VAAASEDVEADVAARLGPLVVLLGQDGSDEADQGVAGGGTPGSGAPLSGSRGQGKSLGSVLVVQPVEVAGEGFGHAGMAGPAAG